MEPAFDDGQLLKAIIAITRKAGDMALPFFRLGEHTSAGVTSKAGGSPVTEADLLVDRYLKEELEALVPGAGWLSEESIDSSERLGRRAVFIVDPIDGTRGFVAGDARWGVSVALVTDGRPTLGVVYMPALSETFAAARGQGATLNGKPIRASSRRDLDGARLAAPGSIVTALREKGFAFEALPRIPSLAYRFASVAAGMADVGIASINAHDWDIAAADLVLEESGARLTGLDGKALVYNGATPRHGILVAAPAALQDSFVVMVVRSRDGAKA